MSDQNTKDVEEKLYSEILSPCELFAARSRSHKIPIRGQKDFFPNDSEHQKQRLEQSLKEHWSLLAEERVERLRNLAKANWIPSEQIVELQTPAGKFWQTMGFSSEGKQRLLPEEALYLMECGNLQVFYQDLPFSIQDGYESFLSPSTVSLQQYQVFAHLKRLGYVVHRFDPSLVPSSYTRQLNLPLSRDRAGRQLKRKRSASPPATSSQAEEQSQSTGDRMQEDKRHLAAPAGSSGTARRTWWDTDDHMERTKRQPDSAPPHWRFSSIHFPDLGSTETPLLTSPDPSLLPGPFPVGGCDIAPWRQKINLRKVKMSAKDQERDEDKHRHQRDINKDREVQQCRNWAEYRELLVRRGRRPTRRHECLWNREVTPLHDPRHPIPTAELLEKIRVTQSTHLLEGASSIKGSDEWRICFNVYQPDLVAGFKKSNPGKPYTRMCVCSFDGPVPDLRAIKLLTFQSGDVPVVIAVVDQGDISFYTFKDFQLPVDVYP
eukprot:XP_011602615.1 PREDICTED: tRNA-splicing endonuclease subunit Sen54 isoform X1 [Takifugu rubripes]